MAEWSRLRLLRVALLFPGAQKTLLKYQYLKRKILRKKDYFDFRKVIRMRILMNIEQYPKSWMSDRKWWDRKEIE